MTILASPPHAPPLTHLQIKGSSCSIELVAFISRLPGFTVQKSYKSTCYGKLINNIYEHSIGCTFYDNCLYNLLNLLKSSIEFDADAKLVR